LQRPVSAQCTHITMANVALLFAAMLGMVAGGTVKEVGDVDKSVKGVDKGLLCAYQVADGLDDAADTIEDVMNAFRSCAHWKSQGGCTGDILEATAEFLQALSALLGIIECTHPNLGMCASTSTSLAGSALDLGVKIKDLATGVCKPSKNVGMGITTVNQTEVEGNKGGACAGGITQMIAALTKTGLGIALTVEICKLPDKNACMSQIFEVAATVSNIVEELVNTVAKCTGHATFNAACGAAISGLTEDTFQLAADGINIGPDCTKSNAELKNSPGPYLKLYDRDLHIKGKEDNSHSQLLPWATSGLLLLMMPAVFKAGRVTSKKSSRRLHALEVVEAADAIE